MPNELAPFELPDGWKCAVEVKQSPDGEYSGRAELIHGREVRCVFVLALQPSHDAVLERVKFRASHFIHEWNSRPIAAAS